MRACFSEAILETGLAFGPHRHAITDSSGTYTWRELQRKVEEAEAYIRRLDLPDRSRVMLLAQDGAWHFILLMAAANAGMIFMPVNSRYTAAELQHTIDAGRPAVVFAEQQFDDRVASFGTEEAEDWGRLRVHRWNMREIPVLSGVATKRTPFLLTFTSGSTAVPKAVLLSLEGEIFTIRAHASTFRLNHNDVVLGGLPLSWVYGLSTCGLSSLFSGAHLVIAQRFSPTLMSKMTADLHVTVFMGVTTHYRIIMEHFRKTGASPFNRKLRLAITGGEKQDEAVSARFEESFGAPVHDLYCTSEGRPGLGYDPALTPRPLKGSCGRPLAGVEARIGGENAETLYIRSAGNYLGYFDAENLVEREVSVDEWIQMGDRFILTEEGWGYVKGRADDLILRGGANIAPAEVEEVLSMHPNVTFCKVLGLDNQAYGQSVAAAIVGQFANQSGVEKELVAWCSERLAVFKVPTDWLFLESIPRNVNDKLDKQALMRLFDAK